MYVQVHLYVGRASSLTHLPKQGETVQDEAAWVRPGDSPCCWLPEGGPVAASAPPGDFRRRFSGSILNLSIYSADP